MEKSIETREKKITEEIITYIAEDGKIFDNETDCREWEKSYKHTVLMSILRIPNIEADDLEGWMPYTTQDTYIYVFRPKTMEHITALNAFDSLFPCSRDSTNACFTADDIGQMIELDICEYNITEATCHTDYAYLCWHRLDIWKSKVEKLYDDMGRLIDEIDDVKETIK